MEQRRTRNTKVCIPCHTRKIKCDLQEHADGPCRNCRKTNQTCREVLIPRKDPAGLLTGSRPRLGLRQRALQSPRTSIARSSERILPTSSPGSVGYLGEESYLGNPSVPRFIDDAAAETTEVHYKILQATGATLLPSRILIDALADLYFEHIYPHQPIVDREDLASDDPSALLVQSLCLVGSSFGHRRGDVSQIKSANVFYLKTKALLEADHEKDNVIVLKALCLLTCRSVTLPTHICLESNWHWQGVAVRYAIHMGLHKAATYATYAGRAAAGSCRRMWWHLFNHDKMSSFCYGRPSAINIRDADVQLPTQADFPVSHQENDIFIERTKLCVILGRLVETRYSPIPNHDEVVAIGEALSQWSQNLPDALLTTNGSRRKPYRRVISELHIIYLTCTILHLQTLAKSDTNSDPPHTSNSRATLEQCVQAASNITGLFEEVHARNEASYLTPINNWFCLVAGVIHIRARAALTHGSPKRTEDLEIIKTVLKDMTATVPSSNLILANLERIEYSARNGLEKLVKDSTNVPSQAPQSGGNRFSHTENTVQQPGDPDPSTSLGDPQNGREEWGCYTPENNYDFDWPFDFDFNDIQVDASMQGI